MDRINELNELLAGCNRLPEALDDGRIRKTVKKKAFKKNVAKTAQYMAGTLAVLFVVFTVCVNTSLAFSRTVSDIPVLNMLARLVSFNRGYEDAVNHKYVTEVNAVGEGNIGTVKIDYVMADERNIVLFSNVTFKDELKSDEMGYFCVNGMWDTDTGAEIEYSGSVSLQKGEDDEYCVNSLYWDGYHRNVKVELEYYDPEDNYVGTGGVEACFETGECLEKREYKLNETIETNGYSYQITGLRIYPMSTEIDVVLLDDVDRKYEQTTDMEFYLRGGEKYRKRTSGIICWHTDNSHKTYVIESGYYVFDEEFVLGLNHIEILPEEYRSVTLDLNTGILTDRFGVIENWSLYEDTNNTYAERRNAICIKNSAAEEGMMSCFVDSPELDAIVGGRSSCTDEGNCEYVYLDKDKLEIVDGKVSLVRRVPLYTIDLEWETVIK